MASKTSKQKKQQLRKELHAKYGGCCAYCGCSIELPQLTVDHIDPQSNGCDNSINNLNPACQFCNSLKSDEKLTDFRIKLSKSIHKNEKAYNSAVRLGLIAEDAPITFYFERYQEQSGQKDKVKKLKDEVQQARNELQATKDELQRTKYNLQKVIEEAGQAQNDLCKAYNDLRQTHYDEFRQLHEGILSHYLQISECYEYCCVCEPDGTLKNKLTVDIKKLVRTTRACLTHLSELAFNQDDSDLTALGG